MALTQENVHYTLNSGPCVMNSCADPGFFFRRGVGGGGRGPTARKQSGQCFFSHQLILQFTEWIQWFYYRGEEGSNFFKGVGVSKETHITCDFPGGGSGPPNPLWIRTWGRLMPLFAYRIMVYQNLDKTEKYHPTTTKRKKSNLLLIEIASADPEGGQGSGPPGKSQVTYMGFYRV